MDCDFDVCTNSKFFERKLKMNINDTLNEFLTCHLFLVEFHFDLACIYIPTRNFFSTLLLSSGIGRPQGFDH